MRKKAEWKKLGVLEGRCKLMGEMGEWRVKYRETEGIDVDGGGEEWQYKGE